MARRRLRPMATTGSQRSTATDLIGREHEIATLMLVLGDDAPRVHFVHGIGGVGKSAPLEHFANGAREAGATVMQLDGGAIEPTARGFNAALSAAMGSSSDVPADPGARLAGLPAPVIVLIDRYELLRPLEFWLRTVFVPAMP